MCKAFDNVFIMTEGVTVYGGPYRDVLFECLDREGMELQEHEANDDPVRIAYTESISKTGIAMPDYITSITSKDESHYQNEDLQRQKDVIQKVINAKRKKENKRAEEYATVSNTKDYNYDMMPRISHIWSNAVYGTKTYLINATAGIR
ncbi:hypothetical protein HK407_12g17940 [Ordospora pajunii]|uniref:uncharacterized protein n=1 Tax=Ordospora pajunii TaxID=3039483 RepID=UPI00295292BA|nr:uncharacterized protein HK407_12g17940 [Ordospora pajunii]KAH9410662.1 hypothetical protein HK407_12g17940 [Ordospora pajunii]